MNRLFGIWILTLMLSLAVVAQKASDVSPRFETPRNLGIVSLIFQPECPLRIEDVQIVTDFRGSFPEVRYRLRNISKKDVVSFSVGFHHRSDVRGWSINADSWLETTGNARNKDFRLRPHRIYENLARVIAAPQLSFDEIQKIFGSTRGEKPLTFWIGFVSHVRFADGSEYKVEHVDEYVANILLVKGEGE